MIFLFVKFFSLLTLPKAARSQHSPVKRANGEKMNQKKLKPTNRNYLLIIILTIVASVSVISTMLAIHGQQENAAVVIADPKTATVPLPVDPPQATTTVQVDSPPTQPLKSLRDCELEIMKQAKEINTAIFCLKRIHIPPEFCDRDRIHYRCFTPTDGDCVFCSADECHEESLKRDFVCNEVWTRREECLTELRIE
ncbi:TPA: hypothetical protein DIC21_04635 [Candidatus Uhrbacteria bacterium]|nr:hypothetical protein [Candidatus Uhrbacteria bacterium]